MNYSIGVVICAGGNGTRAGFEKNKLLVSLQGECVLEKTVKAFDFPAVSQIVIACREEDEEEIKKICVPIPRTQTVIGGNSRGRSVYNALTVLQTDIVLIHDGARPFIKRETIEGCIASVKAYGSGICAVPSADTVAFHKDGYIQSVPARESVCQIQTPQGFFLENIRFAYERAFENEQTSFTDDSSLFSIYCGKPRLCAGARDNIKLTYAQDYQTVSRVGFGIDTHAFGKEQNFVTLGGVQIPCFSGLIAHSDGDVVIHAVMDALLSAAGLKDIGYYFPDSDEKWRDADSTKMLEQVLDAVNENGFIPQNVSIAIQAETPRLAPHIDEMKNTLSRILRLDPTAVGITAGTNEGLGYVGEKKGITVHAYVLLCNK